MEKAKMEKAKLVVTSEQIYDVLPTVVTIYKKIGLKEYRNRLAIENKSKKNIDGASLSIDLFMFVLEQSKDIKEELFEIVGVCEGLTIEEAKLLPPGEMISSLKKLFMSKDAIDLLTLAVK